MKAENSGCGESGRALNSGWNCVPKKNGCFDVGSSEISINFPSGEVPENTKPAFSISFINALLTSYRCLCLSEILSAL